MASSFKFPDAPTGQPYVFPDAPTDRPDFKSLKYRESLNTEYNNTIQKIYSKLITTCRPIPKDVRELNVKLGKIAKHIQLYENEKAGRLYNNKKNKSKKIKYKKHKKTRRPMYKK
jgi:hypothetical protein